MRPLAVWSGVFTLIFIAVVNAAPRSYRYEAFVNSLRVKRQNAATTQTTTPKPASEIKNCERSEPWDTQCKTCGPNTVMSADKYSCLKCPSFCETCTENLETEDKFDTTCNMCMQGFVFDTNPQTNITSCESCATYCTDCDAKATCFQDKCTSTGDGRGTKYDPESQTCQLCDSSCKSCQTNGAGKCDENECMDGYTDVESECQKCPDWCLKCDLVGEDIKCSECATGYALNADSSGCAKCRDNCHECVDGSDSPGCVENRCFEGYVRIADGSCESCAANCKKCQEPDVCDGTADSHSCNIGYGLKPGEESDKGTCDTCGVLCEQCKLNSDTSNMDCTDCEDNFHPATQNTCDFCPENCNTCEIDKTSGKTHCTSSGCKGGFAYRKLDGTCHICPANCKACTYDENMGGSKCNSGSSGCNSGFAMRSTDGKCYECTEGCLFCTDNGEKTECNYDACADRYAYRITDKTCEKCPEACAECKINTNEDVECLMCDARYIANTAKSSCMACPDNCDKCHNENDEAKCNGNRCDEGYFWISGGTCDNCPDGCASCHEDDGTIKCLECKATYAVDNSDTSNLKCEECSNCAEGCTWSTDNSRAECKTCIEGFVEDENKKCQACDHGCSKCTTTECSTCKQGYARATEDVCIECPPGCTGCTLQTSPGVNMNKIFCDACGPGYEKVDNQCLECPDNCVSCNHNDEFSKMECGTCKSGYVVEGDICKACADGCTSCDDNKAGKCDTGSCENTYVFDTGSKTCKKCADQCTGCTTAGTCVGGTCNEGYIAKAGDAGCDACSDDCKVCSAKDKCTTCQMGYALTDEFTCKACKDPNCRFCTWDTVNSQATCLWGLCEPGYYMDHTNSDKCEPCPDGCPECTLPNEGSVECIATFCLTGYVMDELKKTCIKCPTNCRSCRLNSNGDAVCKEEGCDFEYTQVLTPTDASYLDCNPCTDDECTVCNKDTCSVCKLTVGALVSGGSSCEACNGANNCKDCATGKDVCSSCTAPRMLNTDGECVECDAACDGSCDPDSPDVCKICTGNKFKDGTTCTACDVKCNGCEATGAGNCIKCASGHYLNAGTGECTVCTGSNCETCNPDNADECTSCLPAFYHDTPTTCAACNVGCGTTGTCSGPDANHCLTCDEYEGAVSGTCTTCIDDTNCLDCKDDENQCVTCDATTSALRDNVCRTYVCTGGLHKSDGTCNTAVVSTGCLVRYSTDPDATTYDKCPKDFCMPGYVWKKSTETCEDCGNCASCYWDEDASAAKCSPNGCIQKSDSQGRAPDANGDCKDCPPGCFHCEWSVSAGKTVCVDGGCHSDHVKVEALTCVGCGTGCAQCALTVNKLTCNAGQCQEQYAHVGDEGYCFPTPEFCAEGTYSDANGVSLVTCTSNKCIDKYAMNNADNTCHKCPARCSLCTYTNGATVCDKNKCDAGSAQRTDTYECEVCTSNCEHCKYDTGKSATVCLDGGCGVNSGKVQVEVNGVITCVRCSDNCLNCEEDGSGGTRCLAKQCADGYGWLAGECIACSDGCKECDVANDRTTTCTTCKAEYDMITDSKACMACPANCLSCTYMSVTIDSVATLTTKCGSNQCKPGYAQNTADARLQCVECPTQCTQCTYDTAEGKQKTMCDSNKCNPGYAKNDVEGTCDKCSDNCAECSTPGLCSTCNAKYALTSDKLCVKCDPNCKKCQSQGEGKCDSSQCDDRYTLDSENKCKKCDANCKKCSTPGECDSSQCDDRYVFALKTCHACPDNCAECEAVVVDDKVTTACKEKKCDSGYGLKATDKKCHKCPNDCLECEEDNSILKCTKCATEFELNPGVCKSCPKFCKECSYTAGKGMECGTCNDRYAFNTINECQACPSKCKKCKYSSVSKKTECDDNECEEGYAKDAQGQCISCTTLKFDSCSACTDVKVTTVSGGEGQAAVTSTTDSTCTKCAAGYTMADDSNSCKSCSASHLSNCGTCYDRPGHECKKCDGSFKMSENKEVCGYECYTCRAAGDGTDCQTGVSSTTDVEVCADGCWSIGHFTYDKKNKDKGHVAQGVFRGCNNSIDFLRNVTGNHELTIMGDCNGNAEKTCFSNGDAEQTVEPTLCSTCCKSDKCNDKEISGGSRKLVSLSIMSLLLILIKLI